jgi:arylsulfatase B
MELLMIILTRLHTKILAAIFLSFGAMAPATAEQPNVIIIVADDLGWNDVGFHGGDIDTPSLNRLAAEGTELNRFYTTPICSPTRAALMCNTTLG